MADIRTQKLIYHLTGLQNLPSILERGLRPRANLANFVDVADQDIITDRRRLRLERFVPFHFFAKNPFDGRVQHDHPEKRFVLIAVERSKAHSLGWKIIPRHPLAGDDIEVMDYDAGMQAIDWDAMNKRDYSDQHSKCTCMAECIAPGPVAPNLFQSIRVKDTTSEAQGTKHLAGTGLKPFVNVCPAMFSK